MREARGGHTGAAWTAAALVVLSSLPGAAASSSSLAAGPEALAAMPAGLLFENYSATSGLSANASILNRSLADFELSHGFLNGGRGACWLDFDGDGDDDLFVAGPQQSQFFENLGGWAFADVSNASGLDLRGYGMGCAAADLDRDGDQDLWVTFYDSLQALMRNNGDGTFTNVSAGPIAAEKGAHTGVSFGDFDEDGLLDAVVTNYNRQADRLYRNLGNLTFEERSGASGLFDVDWGFQPLVFDHDLDGDVDIVVINDFGFDRLWRNEGGWNFTDATSQTGANDPGGGMGGDVSDVDLDGDLDFYIANYAENSLWVWNGSSFVNRAASAGVDNRSTGWAALFFDYDNDRFEDLFVANGVVDWPSERRQPNVLYRNLGNLTFEDVSAGSGAESNEVGRGGALSDVDGDGRVDVYTTNVNAPNEMLRNVADTQNGWLKVRLEGTLSNPDGVGSLVRVAAANRTQLKPQMAGTGYLSSSSKVMHFGLGASAAVDFVEVVWPTGLVQRVTGPALNTTVVVREQDAEAPVARAPGVSAQQGLPFELNGSASTDNAGIAGWTWTVDVNGTPVVAAGERASVRVFSPGNFTGSLEVADLYGNVANAAFAVDVLPLTAAFVDAGPDFSVPEGTAHTFSATGLSTSAADFENTSAFEWWVTDGAGTILLTGARPTYVFGRVGTVAVHVVVHDSANASAEDFLNVTVTDGSPPTVVAAVPASVDEDVAVTLDASATFDNDPRFPAGATFTWGYDGRAGPVSFAGVNATHVFADPGPVRLKLRVADGSGNSAEVEYSLVVADRTAPAVDAGPDRAAEPGEDVDLSAAGSSDNALDFFENGSFTWRVHYRTGVVVLTGPDRLVTFPEPGVFLVALEASDPTGNAGTPDSLEVTVIDRVAPVPNGGGDRTATLGVPFLFNASLTTDNDPYFKESGRFVWQFQDGSQLQNLEGVLAPYTFLREGEYRVRLSATDAAGNAAAALFTVRVVDGRPPTIAVAPVPASAFAGDRVVLNASGTTDDVGVASLGWRVTGPFAFDVELAGGVGVFVPPLPGTYNATVTARDAAGNAASRAFTIVVGVRPGAGTGTNNTNGTNNTTDIDPRCGLPRPQCSDPRPPQGDGQTERAIAVGLVGLALAVVALVLSQRRSRQRGGKPPQSL